MTADTRTSSRSADFGPDGTEPTARDLQARLPTLGT